MGGNGGKWGESSQDHDRNCLNNLYKWQKNGANGGGMGEKWEKNATGHPCSPIPFFPFFRRAQTFPLVPLTKLSIRYPDGKMGEIESIGGYPTIRVPRRLAALGLAVALSGSDILGPGSRRLAVWPSPAMCTVTAIRRQRLSGATTVGPLSLPGQWLGGHVPP